MDDYDKLCEYMDNLSRDIINPLEVPIVYLNTPIGNNGEYSFFRPYPDEQKTFDDYGNVHYSGVYIYNLATKEHQKISRDDLPDAIFEGRLMISKEIPIKFSPTGPQKVIFQKNKG